MNSWNLQNDLPYFFSNFRLLKERKIESGKSVVASKLNHNSLKGLFDSLVQPLIKTRRSGYACDPWEIAGLERNEVRNCMVLSWLLNPQGSHGFGGILLETLINEINLRSHEKPLPPPGKFCTVRTESNPDGDVSNRYDIEIDDEKFYLIIEVKIDAPESSNQLKRYGLIAQVRADKRPWGIVFLTPKGIASVTAGIFYNKITSLSWRNLSKMLTKCVREECKKSSDKKGASQYMTEQIIFRFLEKIRQF